MVALRGKIEECREGLLRGWMWDPQNPDAALNVSIMVDGQCIAKVDADLQRRDLSAAGIGDGRHGFEVLIPPELRDGQFHLVSLKLDDDRPLPNHARNLQFPNIQQTITGRVEGVKGGALIGWAWDRADADSFIELEVFVGEQLLGLCSADIFRTDLKRAGIGDGRHAFRFPLSPSIFDSEDNALITVKTTAACGGREIGTTSVLGGKSEADIAKVEPAKFASAPPAAAAAVVAKPPAAPPPAPKAPPEPKLTHAELIAKATEAESAKRLKDAQALLDKVLKDSPNNFDALFRQARVLLALGNQKDAKVLALRAIGQRAKHPKPAIILARIAELESNRLLALEYWKYVPKSESAYLERLLKSGKMLIALERPNEGRALLEEAAALKPNDAKVKTALAQLHEDLGDRERALPLWEEVVRLDPNDSKARGRPAKLRQIIREPSYIVLPRRYRHAMSNAERPAMVLTGSDPDAVLIATSLAAYLHDYFELPIIVAVPKLTKFCVFLQSHLPDFIQIDACDNIERGVEIAFLFPEFTTDLNLVAPPPANLTYSYTGSGGVPKPHFHERIEAYVTWLERLLDVPRSSPSLNRGIVAEDAPIGTIFAADAARTSKIPRSLLAAVAAGLKMDILAHDLASEDLEHDMAELSSAFDEHVLTITSDARIANLTACTGLPSLFLGSRRDILPNHLPLVSCLDESDIAHEPLSAKIASLTGTIPQSRSKSRRRNKAQAA